MEKRVCMTGRLVSPKITCGFQAKDGIIVKEGTAPILHKFVGQRIENLEKWAKSIGGEVER